MVEEDQRIIVYLLFASVSNLWYASAQGNSITAVIAAALGILLSSYRLFIVGSSNEKKIVQKLSPIIQSSSSLRYYYNERTATGLILLYSALSKAALLPEIFDCDSWSIQLDMTVACWHLLKFNEEGERSEDDEATTTTTKTSSKEILVRTIRDMMTNYYFAAAFWKLNTHFLDSDSSCATIFVFQLLSKYVMPVLSSNYFWMLASAAKAAAPVGALIVELSMGGLLVLGSVTQRRIYQVGGILLILAFHTMICIMPAPNNICNFALHCSARHILFATPGGLQRALQLVKERVILLSNYSIMVVPSILLLVPAVAIQYQWSAQNCAFALYSVIGSFVVYAILSDTSNDDGIKKEETPVKRSWWSWVAIGIAWFYSFGGLMLGIQEESTPNMFANLKIHGGSNHLILPTGLLFHHFYGYPDSHPFAGGVIRIENTTSDWLRTVYPNDLTSITQPTDRMPLMYETLASGGRREPFYFNSGVSRVLKTLNEVGDPFYRYTVPALEFKRLLEEAKTKDGTFRITFARLPGTKGDEIWRAEASERIVTVDFRDGEVENCRQYYPHSKKKKSTSLPCPPDELPMIPPSVPWIFRYLTLNHAYPIVTLKDGSPTPSIVCFGP